MRMPFYPLLHAEIVGEPVRRFDRFEPDGYDTLPQRVGEANFARNIL